VELQQNKRNINFNISSLTKPVDGIILHLHGDLCMVSTLHMDVSCSQTLPFSTYKERIAPYMQKLEFCLILKSSQRDYIIVNGKPSDSQRSLSVTVAAAMERKNQEATKFLIPSGQRVQRESSHRHEESYGDGVLTEEAESPESDTVGISKSRRRKWRLQRKGHSKYLQMLLFAVVAEPTRT